MSLSPKQQQFMLQILKNKTRMAEAEQQEA